jgi:glycosyltransferase involved in cell wall biosynthesis
VVDRFNNFVHPVKLHIYSIDKNVKFMSKISNLKSVEIHEAVPVDEIPSLITKFDIAFLPIDFTKEGIAYAKYSISTKTSEYMISGVPILLFAPENVALTKYARENKCMFTVSENNADKLFDALNLLINDKNLRSTLAQNSIAVAKSTSDALVVRKKFQNALMCSKQNC